MISPFVRGWSFELGKENTEKGENTKIWQNSQVLKAAKIGSDSSIGHNCFIGSRSIVVEGVHIGKEAVLGANVVITQSGSGAAATGLQNVIGGNENNIESASVSYDSADRFGKYVLK